METLYALIVMSNLILILTVAITTACVYRQGLRDGQDLSKNIKLKDVPAPFSLPKKANDSENNTGLSNYDEGMRNIMAHFNRHKEKPEDKE